MINKEAENNTLREFIPEQEILPLLYSIVNTKLDTLANLDYFLQLIVDIGSKIVCARNSSLVIFTECLESFFTDSKKKFESHIHPIQNVCRSESHITIPLILRETKDAFGYLRVEGKVNNQNFDSRDLFLLLLLSRQATLKIENDLLYKRVQKNLASTLGAIIRAMETREQYIQAHSQRVTQWALNIAADLGLDEKEKEILRLAGLLHDLGKIGIPDAILSKKEFLTEDELALIRNHPLIGEEILDSLESFTMEKAIIRNHHERLDGSGYPDGLADDQISTSLRIIAVADSFEAMTSPRPYHKAKSLVESVKELEYLSNEKYDKHVVQSLKRLLTAH